MARGEDIPTAIPAGVRAVKPGTSEFARDALRKSEARENHLLEVAIDAMEDRAKSAESIGLLVLGLVRVGRP